jgi:hypothetical protein
MKTIVTFHRYREHGVIEDFLCGLYIPSFIIGYESFGGSSIPTHLKHKHFVECRIDTHLRIILKNINYISLSKDVFCSAGNTW